MSKIYHVAKDGNDKNSGTNNDRFLTIQKAANTAIAGDTIIVHEGVYREWVKPVNSGTDKFHPISYIAAPNEKVIIKGSEIIKNWINVENGIWKTEIDNSIFEGYNPFEKEIFGDWLDDPRTYKVHLGDLYVNGKSMYEAPDMNNLKNPSKRYSYLRDFLNVREYIPESDYTIYVYFAEIKNKKTILYGNFHEIDPNLNITEINVRRSCFMPTKTHVNYITVKGFEMCNAATPWAPPTADQPGLLGPYWGKGWIIANNIIHDSKCVGITIGKEYSTGDNDSSKFQKNSGYLNQLESVFSALKIGWSKETIGSHTIINNTIFNCGQAGIVGHLGCVFSKIIHNEIYNIGRKHEFVGFEIAGIKFHAPIDVEIYENNIHECVLGIWLDWQTQGTRVSRNILYNNDRDITIEVSHGPYLVDNNVFASKYNVQNASQGGAYVHNLFCGCSKNFNVLKRATPYHYPHSTSVAGYSLIYGHDDRYFNNIFIGGSELPVSDCYNGTNGYDNCPASYEEFKELYKNNPNRDDLNKFITNNQPIYISGNTYLKKAIPCIREKENLNIPNFDPQILIKEENNDIFISINIPEEINKMQNSIIDTEKLKETRISKCIFDNAAGDFININYDITNQKRKKNPTSGPFENLEPGNNLIKIWSK